MEPLQISLTQDPVNKRARNFLVDRNELAFLHKTCFEFFLN